MNFYLKMLIKILERSMIANDSEILKKLKSGYDLSSEEKKELEEMIDNLIQEEKMSNRYLYDRQKTAITYGEIKLPLEYRVERTVYCFANYFKN